MKGWTRRRKKISTQSDEPFTGPGVVDAHERPNYERWQKWAVCPKHHALAGFVFHFQTFSGNKPWALTGVQGMCRPMVWRD